MVICVLIPRFELIAACANDWLKLRGPAALAPEAGQSQVVGQVSRAAEEAFGILPGMRVGEALARCPEIRLIPPDPVQAAKLWDQTLERLEAIGAEVESQQPGEALFAADGLLTLYGGLDRLLEVTSGASSQQRALTAATRITAAATPFAARAAAWFEESSGDEERQGQPLSAATRQIAADQTRPFLAALPITTLTIESTVEARLIADLKRLGIATLGDLAAIPATQIADRFGHPGLRARHLAVGGSEPLRPRRPPEQLEQTLDLPDSTDGSQLEYALKLLIDRFLAMPRRQDRMIRSLVLSATLAGGGSWRRRIALNQPSGSAEILLLALLPSLDVLPGPVSSLSLQALELGATAPDQQPLDLDAERQRRARLAEAVRQTRANAGPDALLRVLSLSPDARLPERRLTLSPYESPALNDLRDSS